MGFFMDSFLHAQKCHNGGLYFGVVCRAKKLYNRQVCIIFIRSIIKGESQIMIKAEELIREMPKGLLKWYGFRRGASALLVTAETELDLALSEALSESGLNTVQMSMPKLEACREEESFDYVVIADAVSRVSDTQVLFRQIRRLLRESGTLFVCADNRLGIRYFCGDKDPFTGRNFDGIENYRRISKIDVEKLTGRLYAKAELTDMLEQAGFFTHRFYSVLPDISRPQLLVAEDSNPEEELKIRIFPQYNSPDTVFLEEENLYTTLIQNGMFHTMANGFLIECPLSGSFANAKMITASMDRGKENALFTIIRRDGRVEKKPAHKEGNKKAHRLLESARYLKEHGVRMIEGEIRGDSFVMPYVEGEPLVKYFRTLAERDRQEFYRQFDRLWEIILSSSEHVPYEEVDWEHFNPWWDEEKNEKVRQRTDRDRWRRAAFGEEREALGAVLRRGYIDLVLLNGFAADGEFIFYDQELYVEQLPAKAILLRNINFLYHGDVQMQKLIPNEELILRYQLKPCQEIYYAHIGHFLTKLRNDDVLDSYHRQHRCNMEVLHSNRQRMNYSEEEYQRLFVDIFKNTDNKALYLFGSGNFTKKFLALYGEEYAITGILDNNPEKWGETLDGIRIFPPSALEGIDASLYKVIICIKNYTGVLAQVKQLGASNIGIYDTNMEYPRKPRALSPLTARTEEKKKYHVGYVAGVFDLFHIGHLNLLKRAKEQCDYLIVGVVTDEGVRKNKKTECFIPFEERLAIVSACRYVDEAVGIPLEFADTKDAYLKFQFDAQFSGSDYDGDPAWQKKREFLREHGAELVFFPYTESTSSTRIKGMIEKKLI